MHRLPGMHACLYQSIYRLHDIPTMLPACRASFSRRNWCYQARGTSKRVGVFYIFQRHTRGISMHTQPACISCQLASCRSNTTKKCQHRDIQEKKTCRLQQIMCIMMEWDELHVCLHVYFPYIGAISDTWPTAAQPARHKQPRKSNMQATLTKLTP
jgi:hypothetical protein